MAKNVACILATTYKGYPKKEKKKKSGMIVGTEIQYTTAPCHLIENNVNMEWLAFKWNIEFKLWR